jgi:hypothetical protein
LKNTANCENKLVHLAVIKNAFGSNEQAAEQPTKLSKTISSAIQTRETNKLNTANQHNYKVIAQLERYPSQ